MSASKLEPRRFDDKNSCLGGFTTRSFYTPKAIHIINDTQFEGCLNIHTEKIGLSAALMLQADFYYFKYEGFFGESLKIDRRSIALEIAGHVFPDKFFRYLPDSVYKVLRAHTEVIDIGEESVDSNRIIWDRLVAVHDAIGDSTNIVLPILDVAIEMSTKVRKDIQDKALDPLLSEILKCHHNRSKKPNLSNNTLLSPDNTSQ